MTKGRLEDQCLLISTPTPGSTTISNLETFETLTTEADRRRKQQLILRLEATDVYRGRLGDSLASSITEFSIAIIIYSNYKAEKCYV